MKTKLVTIPVMIACLVMMISCRPGNTGTNKPSASRNQTLEDARIREEIVKIIQSMPSSTETVNLINATGASYLAGFTGESMKTDDLLTRADKAKAYGTIIFDMAYTNTYNQVESFSKLAKIYETLTKDLGFEELDETQKMFKERFQRNRNNPDSIEILVNGLLKTTNDLIRKTGSAADISLVFAGAVVKSLNVISYLTLFAPGKEKLLQVLQQQKNVINAACMILEKSPSDPEINQFLQALLPINKIFNETPSFSTQSVEEINKLTAFITQ